MVEDVEAIMTGFNSMNCSALINPDGRGLSLFFVS